jgi:hypothetical protein
MGGADFLYPIMASQTPLDLSGHSGLDFLHSERQAPCSFHPAEQLSFGDGTF